MKRTNKNSFLTQIHAYYTHIHADLNIICDHLRLICENLRSIYFFRVIFIFLCFIFLTNYAYSQEVVVYSRLTEGYWQIWMMQPDGSNQRQLTTSPEDKRNPTISDDGKTLVYRTHNSRLFSLDLETNTITEILKNMGNIVDPVFEGDSLVFSRNKPDTRCDSDLWQASLDGEAVQKITKHICVEYHPQLSLQKDFMVFVLQDESGSETQPQIGLLDLKKQGKVTYFLTKEGSNLRPSISLDGKTIAFSSNRSGDYEIWTMNTKGKELTQLTHNHSFDYHPVFSPDGKEIVFVSDRTGSLQLWKMDRQGNNLRQLTSGQGDCIDPIWIRITTNLDTNNHEFISGD